MYTKFRGLPTWIRRISGAASCLDSNYEIRKILGLHLFFEILKFQKISSAAFKQAPGQGRRHRICNGATGSELAMTGEGVADKF